MLSRCFSDGFMSWRPCFLGSTADVWFPAAADEFVAMVYCVAPSWPPYPMPYTSNALHRVMQQRCALNDGTAPRANVGTCAVGALHSA
eukprot:7705310-Pyramimonas_sp.AAC.1